jgi:hypothetical protein
MIKMRNSTNVFLLSLGKGTRFITRHFSYLCIQLMINLAISIPKTILLLSHKKINDCNEWAIMLVGWNQVDVISFPFVTMSSQFHICSPKLIFQSPWMLYPQHWSTPNCYLIKSSFTGIYLL